MIEETGVDPQMVNLVKNAAMVKKMMANENIDTGDDVEAFVRDKFIPMMDQRTQAQQDPEVNKLEANKAIIQKYRSYLG